MYHYGGVDGDNGLVVVVMVLIVVVFYQWRTLREILGVRNFQHVCLWCRFKICEI